MYILIVHYKCDCMRSSYMHFGVFIHLFLLISQHCDMYTFHKCLCKAAKMKNKNEMKNNETSNTIMCIQFVSRYLCIFWMAIFFPIHFVSHSFSLFLSFLLKLLVGKRKCVLQLIPAKTVSRTIYKW